ncbi:MAG: hypothetical protein ACJ76I_09385 [Gaiellaceae bacterium]
MSKKRHFQLPLFRTVSAAVAVATLSEGHDGGALWHERADGGLEVAAVDNGCLCLHLVHDDGTTAVIDRLPPARGRREARSVSYAGTALCGLSLITAPAGVMSFASAAVVFVTGMAVMGAGMSVALYEGSIAFRLRHRRDQGDEWHEAINLDRWIPRTMTQLTAVKDLADRNKGIAYVRDRGGVSLDVVVPAAWQTAHRFRLDGDGLVEPGDFGANVRSSKDWHEIRTFLVDND